MKLHMWRGYVTFASKQKTDLTGLGSFRTRSGGGTPSFTSGGSYPFWNKIYKFGENSKQYTNTYQYMHPMSPFNVPDYICGDPDAGMPIFGIQNVGLFSVCPVCGLRRGIPPNDVSCWGFPCVGPRLLALSLLPRISPRILESFSNVLYKPATLRKDTVRQNAGLYTTQKQGPGDVPFASTNTRGLSAYIAPLTRWPLGRHFE